MVLSLTLRYNHRTRAEKEVEMEVAKGRSREAEILRQLKLEGGAVRLMPVGYDRHWNRYWLLHDSEDDADGENSF